ncbi:MAG: thiol-disulfide isomerase/thioredoxin [Flavobacteriales bacterium]|jgi:thiol-disulfide isomerase/thioredoxin
MDILKIYLMKKIILSLGVLLAIVFMFSNFMSNDDANTAVISDLSAPMVGTSIGDLAPDIDLASPDGEKMKLSDLRGKVVLVDFWASWCGPCRRENPNIVDVYNRYHDAKFKKSKFKVEHRQPAGFEVFSVSLDADMARWKGAIEKDGLVWDGHVSDLKKWNSAAAADYGVHSIPSGFLVDANGVIIASGKELRGPGLENNLKPLVDKTKR